MHSKCLNNYTFGVHTCTKTDRGESLHPEYLFLHLFKHFSTGGRVQISTLRGATRITGESLQISDTTCIHIALKNTYPC